MTDREIAEQQVGMERLETGYWSVMVRGNEVWRGIREGAAAAVMCGRAALVAGRETARTDLGSSPEARVLADLLADQGFTEAADWLQERFNCPPTVAQEPASLRELLDQPEMYSDEAIERLRDRCTEILATRWNLPTPRPNRDRCTQCGATTQLLGLPCPGCRQRLAARADARDNYDQIAEEAIRAKAVLPDVGTIRATMYETDHTTKDL